MLQEILEKLGYKSWLYKEGKNRTVFALETTAKFLDFNLNPLKLKTKREKIAYLRGFFDSEGGIPQKDSYKFYIQLTQKNKNKIVRLKKILTELKINSGKVHNPSARTDPNYWRIFVSVKSHYDFIKIVWSWHPVKQNILRRRVKI